MDRVEFLSGLLGHRWEANARGPDRWDCWHLVRHIEKELAGRDLSDVDVPSDPSWMWMVRTIRSHPEMKNWKEILPDAMGVVPASDLSVVLMARKKNPAHVGVWLRPEGVVVHCDQDYGVCFENLAELHMKGWTKLRFYEPI